MAKKQARGTKRTCQSTECGARFYDLDRDPIVCPICGSIYELASSPRLTEAIAEEKAAARKPKKAEIEEEVAAGEEAEAADIEADETIETDADETFLEEEEEEGDMSNIIGGVNEGDEEP
ncbi:MAG: TIGR02300 family protein [Pseudomonadota bacterium]